MAGPTSSQSPAAAHPRAGRNLPAAIGVGLALGCTAIALLWFARPYMTVFVVVGVLVAVRELVGVFNNATVADSVIVAPDGTPAPVPAEPGPVRSALPAAPMYAGAVAMQLSALFGGPKWLLTAYIATALISVAWRMPAGTARFVHDVTTTVFTLTWVPLAAGFCVLLIRESDGGWRTAAFIVVAVCSDIGGYAAGVLFGRHPMAPTISPKKSWEGFAGSLVCCMVAGWLLLMPLHGHWCAGLVLGFAGVLASTGGDLMESMVKRDLGIKDMSNLLPGHGGIMDRLDSLVFFAPFAWAILYFLVPVQH